MCEADILLEKQELYRRAISYMADHESETNEDIALIAYLFDKDEDAVLFDVNNLVEDINAACDIFSAEKDV